MESGVYYYYWVLFQLLILFTLNPFTGVIPYSGIMDGASCVMLRAVPTAPGSVTPAHRSNLQSRCALGGGTGCPLEVPRPPLGRFDDPPERWPLP